MFIKTQIILKLCEFFFLDYVNILYLEIENQVYVYYFQNCIKGKSGIKK